MCASTSGRSQGTPGVHPLSVQILSFSCSFQQRMLPLRSWCPWIHHWLLVSSVLISQYTKSWCMVAAGYGRWCAYKVIRWSLWGSYVCFITTTLDIFDTSLLLILCTTCQIPNYCYYAASWVDVLYMGELTESLSTCTILYKTLNMHLVASIIGCRFHELISCLAVTFGGAPGSNVDDSLDGVHLGPFSSTYISIL